MNWKMWSGVVKEAFGAGFFVAKFFCALHVTNTYLLTTALVYGPSMLPTFDISGDLVLAERISPRFEKIRRGDVVLIRSTENPKKVATKRVTAMEGDSVTYSDDPGSDKSNTVIVPKGHVWIEGDNKYVSHDSRKFGPVPYGLIEARIFWKIWPFGSVAKRIE